MSTATEIIQEPSTLIQLLPYIPGTWINLHLPVAIGPLVFFNDFAKMRSDLGIPASITGESTRKDKLKIITGIKNYLQFAPDGIDVIGPGAFEEWGWDIADIDGTLYFSDFELAIIVGHFGRSKIVDKLSSKGYSLQKIGEFNLFVSPESEYKFALKDDTLIVGKTIEGNNGVDLILKNISQNIPGIDKSPIMKNLLPLIKNANSVVLMPSPDLETWMKNFHQEIAKLPPNILQGMQTLVPADAEVAPLNWDFSAIAIQGKKSTEATLLYHFATAGDAKNSQNLLKLSLENTPSYSIQNRMWSELITLDGVETYDNLLIGHIHTESDRLITSAFNNRDAYVFLLAQDH